MGTAGKFDSLDLTSARRVLEGGYFDEAFYRRSAHLPSDADAFEHFYQESLRPGLEPNIVFNTRWYLEQNPDVAQSQLNALLHYALFGEALGRDPSPLFETRWYAETNRTNKPLAHYLAHRFGTFSPIPEFDAAYYMRAYPDVAEARMDPFLHYMHFGYREFRKPSADFNPRLYANRHLADDRGANPIADLRRRKREGRPLEPLRAAPTSFDLVRKHARAGPLFEQNETRPGRPRPDAMVLAYYLTQFHRIAENDAWWGEGFTEWTQLGRGQPRFHGHYQPRTPGACGFYDLSDPKIMREQARQAKAAGVHGFVFYYYDFDGRRLLEKPLEQFLTAPDIDIAFCLMWANENWTRRWDGADSEVLIAQTYEERDERRRCAEFVRHFRDPRYVRLEGRPLLMVYRAGLIPECARTIARWRRIFAEHFGENPIFVMAQCFDDVDPRPLGFDAAVEFPPHKLTKGLPQIYDSLDIFDDHFEADVFAYDDLAVASLGVTADFPLIKTVVPHWDNDARRQGQGLTLVGSTPIKYERWLSKMLACARARPTFGQPIVCINAWNEWSEGAYLEPDAHFGWAYLNATARANYGEPRRKAQLLVVGHRDDRRLAEWARQLSAAYGFEVVRDVPTAAPSGASVAIVGAGASGSIAGLVRAGVRSLWLFEQIEGAEADALQRADFVVFADERIKQSALAAVGIEDRKSFVVEPASGGGEPETLASDGDVRWLRDMLIPDVANISAAVIHRKGAEQARPSLEAVFAQTHPVLEVLVFDETASDSSFDEIDACARDADRDATVVIEDQPSERVSLWRRAVEMAAGDFIWIADTESAADPELLTRLSAPLQADARIAATFCDCRPSETQGRATPPRVSPLATRKAGFGFVDATFEGGDFVRRLASDPGLIPRLECALWRRDALTRALSHVDSELEADLRRVIEAVATEAQTRIGYVAETLMFTIAP
jgi:hypothetical protein